MRQIPALWRASLIVFISSFCVMVIELIAGRILAPHIGVSLYTWTSIIGVILAGIALGNYLGGKVADRYPSYLWLVAVFLVGGLLTILILPSVKIVASNNWFGSLPVMWNFMLKTSFIFFLPAVVLSMVSPLVIKQSLADLGQTGGIVGTIYATSTVGAILGTFMTGFYLILWFGTSTIIWIIGAILVFLGLVIWVTKRSSNKWRFSKMNLALWLSIIVVVATYVSLFSFRGYWQQANIQESNYFTIKVRTYEGDVKKLVLDNLVHGYVDPERPYVLIYTYEKIFKEIVSYYVRDNPAPKVLHLGGGSYTFPRFMEYRYSDSVNDVVEIDPVVTEVAHTELGLSYDTSIRTINRDARIFLIERQSADKYDIVIGDVFNDKSTPYHLTTMEFDMLAKSHMKEGGIYMINIIDDFKDGEYLPAFIHTLKQVFRNVYLLNDSDDWATVKVSTFVILATDSEIDLESYRKYAGSTGTLMGSILDETKLETYLDERDPILLIDDYVPTDILVSRLFR